MIIMNENVFENKTRKKIYNHIKIHPGIPFNIIKKVFDLKEGTLRYHLKYLESRNEIRSFTKGKKRCFYPIKKTIFNSRSELDLRLHRLTNSQEQLLNAIQCKPGITQKELIYMTGLKRITITINMKKLLGYGVVRKEPNGKYICYYYISDTELRKKLIKKLVFKFVNNEIEEKTFLALKKRLEE